jgi:hypothetical protein
MPRKPYECSSCFRRFRNAQALFGHLRHCERHGRLKEEAKVEAGNQPPGQVRPKEDQSRPDIHADAKPSSGRFGRDSQDNLLLLLDVHELLPDLKHLCLERARIARLLGTLQPGLTSVEEWVSLYWIIDECERDHEQMVMRLSLDRMILFGIYQRMLVVKTNWLNYQFNDCDKRTEIVSEERHENRGFALEEEERIWTTIMTNVKRMLVGAHH